MTTLTSRASFERGKHQLLESISRNGLELLVPPGERRIAFTSRVGGVSTGRYRGLNLATHTGDDPRSVYSNRRMVSRALGIDHRWVTLNQVHGCRVVVAGDAPSGPGSAARTHGVAAGGSGADLGAAPAHGEASPDSGGADLDALTHGDALIVGEGAPPVAILVADCIPVALAGARRSAVVHAGWRGLCRGVVEEAVREMDDAGIRAWVGPGIGVCHYEVGPELLSAFSGAYPDAPDLSRRKEGRLYFDLPAATRWVLRNSGVAVDDDPAPCTACNPNLYSYRRDGVTGRQAVIAWR